MIKLLVILPAFLATFSAFAARQILPSVQHIDKQNKNKFDISVYKCISAQEDLKQLYMQDDVKYALQKKHKTFTNCSDIEKSLKEISAIQNEINFIVNLPQCAEGVDASIISHETAKETKEMVTERYNKVSQSYTKYFNYDGRLANIEACINFYDKLVTMQNINKLEEEKFQEFTEAQYVANKKGLRGIYGNENGVKNLETTTSEINAREILLYDVAKYAILEYERERWNLVGAFGKNFVYSNGVAYIAFEAQLGKNYETDCLPHKLFQIQKKVDIKKNGYSIFIVKPLL